MLRRIYFKEQEFLLSILVSPAISTPVGYFWCRDFHSHVFSRADQTSAVAVFSLVPIVRED